MVHPYSALHEYSNTAEFYQIMPELATYSSDHHPEIYSRLYSCHDYKFMLGVTHVKTH